MDVEMQEIMDEIMEISHQIGWWMMEFQQKELEGIEIKREQVIENKIIKMLYERAQAQYRKLENRINYKIETQKNKYVENDSLQMIESLEDKIIKQLQIYLDSSYAHLRYVPFTIGKGRMTTDGIYWNTPNEGIIESELTLQSLNMDQMKKRLKSEKSPERYSFIDKSEILQWLARREFCSDFAMNRLDKCLDNCDRNKSKLHEDAYIFEREKIIENKYMQYYIYLNNKYHGFLQENDYGKFAKAKYYAKEGLLSMAFNMTEYEIDENIRLNKTSLMNELEKYIKEIDTIACKTSRELFKAGNQSIRMNDRDR